MLRQILVKLSADNFGVKYFLRCIVGIFWIVRLPMLIIIILTVAVVLRLCEEVSLSRVVLLSSPLFFLYGGAFALNDIIDREIDKINLPHRPIPSGLISTWGGAIVSVFFLFIGIYITASFDRESLCYGLIGVALASMYSFGLKRILVLKNVLASLLNSSIFVFLSLHIIIPEIAWFLFVITFILCIGRELILDARDAYGDAANGIRTVATELGVNRTTWLGYFFSSTGIVLSITPCLGHFDIGFKASKNLIILAFAFLVGGFFFIYCRSCKSQKRLWLLEEYLKIYKLVYVFSLWFLAK